jgi:hypothetical protein
VSSSQYEGGLAEISAYLTLKAFGESRRQIYGQQQREEAREYRGAWRRMSADVPPTENVVDTALSSRIHEPATRHENDSALP